MTEQRGIIDLTNYKEEDLLIKDLQNNTLALQLDGTVTLTVKGKHSVFSTWNDLTAINLGTLSKTSSLTGNGVYVIAISGIDEVQFTASGTGKISWKELGD